ncbi:hypothetical protein HD806DRAFT_551085 [Xylariaceae sp. AK1471]|nr:hypothetical protein HD806DRAFT_551085 [Xylariaceae sp. AK1471]
MQLHYVWKYGPTAILTIISLAWSRVSFQAQMLAPWYRMQRSQTSAEDGLLLDYLDMLPTTAIPKALRRRDWAPAAGSSVYLILQVLVTLSTSLLDLRAVKIESAVLVELNTRFRNASSTDIEEAALGFGGYAMAGILDFHQPYPPGTNALYAYQSPSQTPELGTSLQMDVDGFSATLECANATLEQYHVRDTPEDHSSSSLYLQVQAGDCSIELEFEISLSYFKLYGNYTSYFVRVLRKSCLGTGGAQAANTYRAVFVFVRMDSSIDYATDNSALYAYDTIPNIEIVNSTQLVCEPKYSLQTLRLSQSENSTGVVAVSPTQDSRILNGTIAYSFMLAQLQMQGEGETELGNYSTIFFDQYSGVSVTELSREPSADLTDPNIWFNAIAHFYQKFSAQIAKAALLERVSSTVSAVKRQSEVRLIISEPICHAMAVLLGFCALSSIVIFFSIPKSTVLEMNPATVLSTLRTAREATSLILRLRNQAQGESQSIQNQLVTAVYMLAQLDENVSTLIADYQCPHIQPRNFRSLPKPRHRGKYAMALHPISRCLFALSLGGSIAALEILLRASQKNDGVGSADLNHYFQYSWTLAPSIILTVISMAAGSMDSALRSLIPFVNLRYGGSLGYTVGLDCLDGSIPRMIFRAAKLRAWTLLFSMAAFLISSILTTLSDSLYTNRHVPIKFDIKLWVDTTLTTYGDIDKGGIILNNFSLSDAIGGKDSVASTTILAIPARRTQLLCRIYKDDQIRKNLTLGSVASVWNPTWETHFRISNPLRMDIEDESCWTNNSSSEFTASTIMIPTLQEDVREGTITFGVSSTMNSHTERPTVEVFQDGRTGWVGGCVDAFALSCNATWEDVNAQVHFDSTALTIDASHPPVVDERSTQPTVDKVASAIKAQHGLVQANYISQKYRTLAGESSLKAAADDKPDLQASFYNATATILPGHFRVFQDPQSTRVLQGLLGATLAFSLLAWSLAPRTDIIVGSPTSIARKIALAAGGNMFEELWPSGSAETQSSEGRTFVIGWRSPGRKEKERFGIWLLAPDELEKWRATGKPASKSGKKTSGR